MDFLPEIYYLKCFCSPNKLGISFTTSQGFFPLSLKESGVSTEPQVYRCGNQSHSLGATQRGCDGTQRRHPWAGCWVAWWLFGRILRMSGPQEIATLRGGGRSGKRGPRRAPSPRTLCGKPAWGAEKPPLFPGRSARATAALGLGLRFSCVEAEVRILVKVPKNLQCCRNLGPVLGPAVSVGS